LRLDTDQIVKDYKAQLGLLQSQKKEALGKMQANSASLSGLYDRVVEATRIGVMRKAAELIDEKLGGEELDTRDKEEGPDQVLPPLGKRITLPQEKTNLMDPTAIYKELCYREFELARSHIVRQELEDTLY
jgi:hypothetical protein